MDRRFRIGVVVGALAGALAVAALGGESGVNAQVRAERHFVECYALQVTGVVGEGVGGALRGSSAPLVPDADPERLVRRGHGVAGAGRGDRPVIDPASALRDGQRDRARR